MGFPLGIDTVSKEPPSDSNFSAIALNSHCRDRELKIKSILVNMIWRFGFPCVRPDSGQIQNENDTKSKKSKNLENNKAWLLAESGGCGAESITADPHSLHSSFRFSLCSQIELESMKMSSSTAATVLMVNLDNGVSERRAKELAWRRFETVEKNISPVANTLIRFSHGEILSATNNFSKGRVLGRGALSLVFKGRIGHLKAAVAIKRLDKEDRESAKAFCRELMIASSLQSPKIVPLLGFCIDPEQGLFLVYKFISGGSLEKHLHDPFAEKKKRVKGRSPLPWAVRYKVAVGVAEAVAYLHNGTERCIVHRDIKPSNILLSSKKSPKLCDFGLATWTSAPSVPFLCKTVKGTFGYLAPEYFQHGKISDKTDVYALGVVLLELITGRKPIESNRPPGEENLLLWAKPLLQKGKAAVADLLDPRLKYSFKDSNQIARVIEAASACIMTEESRRPRMNEILALLKGDEESLNSESKKSNFLGHGFDTECDPQSEQSKSEMKSHLAVAMVGVAEKLYDCSSVLN